jgi:hypothetical protein
MEVVKEVASNNRQWSYSMPKTSDRVNKAVIGFSTFSLLPRGNMRPVNNFDSSVWSLSTLGACINTLYQCIQNTP